MLTFLLALLAYSRASFGGWLDVDHDCQDTRAEILIARSLMAVTFTGPKHCFVATGLWIDEYSGELVHDASKLDVDHIVPLAEAWRSGAFAWNDLQRSEFANDPSELVLTSLHTNRSKGDRTPDLWSPDGQPWRCLYFARWVQVKLKYGLMFSTAEAATLNACEAE